MRKVASKSEQGKIRCAMTDAQFCEIVHKLSEAAGLLDVSQSKVHEYESECEDRNGGLSTSLDLIQERVKKASDLMARAWDRTREARHGH
jgi:hypothetical protein